MHSVWERLEILLLISPKHSKWKVFVHHSFKVRKKAQCVLSQFNKCCVLKHLFLRSRDEWSGGGKTSCSWTSCCWNHWWEASVCLPSENCVMTITDSEHVKIDCFVTCLSWWKLISKIATFRSHVVGCYDVRTTSTSNIPMWITWTKLWFIW